MRAKHGTAVCAWAVEQACLQKPRGDRKLLRHVLAHWDARGLVKLLLWNIFTPKILDGYY